MRIQPVFNRLNNTNINKKQTQFESNNMTVQCIPSRLYTGIASVDLAYASMFDRTIAKDLKIMGLI